MSCIALRGAEAVDVKWSLEKQFGREMGLASKGLVEKHSGFLIGIKDSQFCELCWSHASKVKCISWYNPADFSLKVNVGAWAWS